MSVNFVSRAIFNSHSYLIHDNKKKIKKDRYKQIKRDQNINNYIKIR